MEKGIVLLIGNFDGDLYKLISKYSSNFKRNYKLGLDIDEYNLELGSMSILIARPLVLPINEEKRYNLAVAVSGQDMDLAKKIMKDLKSKLEIELVDPPLLAVCDALGKLGVSPITANRR